MKNFWEEIDTEDDHRFKGEWNERAFGVFITDLDDDAYWPDLTIFTQDLGGAGWGGRLCVSFADCPKVRALAIDLLQSLQWENLTPGQVRRALSERGLSERED